MCLQLSKQEECLILQVRKQPLWGADCIASLRWAVRQSWVFWLLRCVYVLGPWVCALTEPVDSGVGSALHKDTWPRGCVKAEVQPWLCTGPGCCHSEDVFRNTIWIVFLWVSFWPPAAAWVLWAVPIRSSPHSLVPGGYLELFTEKPDRLHCGQWRYWTALCPAQCNWSGRNLWPWQ